jgi:polysaccharide transporter, PST family
MLLAYLYLLGVILEIFLPDFLFLGLEKMASITTRYLVAKTVSTLLTFVLVRSKADILWVPLLNIAGTLLAASLIWFQIYFTLKIKMTFSRWKEAFAMLKESSIYFFSSFATTAFGVTNTLLIGLFAPTAQVSFWGVSYNLINSATSLYKPITNSLYPHMISKKDTKLIRWLLFGLFPVIIAVTAVVFIFSKEVITVFCGPKYLEAIPVFQALLPVLIFSFPVMVMGFPVLGAFGMVRETTRSTVIAAVFHIAGLAFLLACGWFNVLNIAILRSGTEAVLLGSRCYFLLRYLRKRKKPAQA